MKLARPILQSRRSGRMSLMLGCVLLLLLALSTGAGISQVNESPIDARASADSITPKPDSATSRSKSTSTLDNPLIATPDDEQQSIAGHLAFLNDPTLEIDLPAAIQAWQRGDFQPLPGTLNRGYTAAGSWLHLTLLLEPGVESPLMLQLHPQYLDRVEVWVQQGQNPTVPASYTHFSIGDHTPVASRPEPRGSMALDLFPADASGVLEQPRQIQIFIQVETTSTHVLGGTVESYFAYHRHSLSNVMLQSGYVAIALVLALINVILAVQLRDSVHGYYAAYLLMLGIGYAAMEGLTNQVIPGSAHMLSDYLVGLASGVSFSLVSLMITRLFRTRQRYPWIHRFLLLIVVTGLLTSLTAGTASYRWFAQINFLLGLVFLCVAFGLAWVRMRASDPAGRLFVIAFSASFIGGLISFSRILGFLPSTDFTFYALQMASVAHMIMMTLALSERLLAAEKKALDASRDAERRAGELVEARTAQLLESKLRLEQTLERERDLRREQADFIDTISHEYRTPLAILKTNLDILQIRSALETKRFVTMRTALARLSDIFNDALQAHHIGRPPGKHLEFLDLRDLLTDAIDDYGRLHPEDSLCFDPGDQSLEVAVDRRMMNLVLQNLLQNAGKYMDRSVANPCIDVWFERASECWELHLANPVDPMIDLDRNRLVQRCFRAPEHRRGDHPGMGLGLYLVQRGVADMQGSLEILTEPADRFEVVIRLPVGRRLR